MSEVDSDDDEVVLLVTRTPEGATASSPTSAATNFAAITAPCGGDDGGLGNNDRDRPQGGSGANRASATTNSPTSVAENAAAFTVPRGGDDRGFRNTDRDSSLGGFGATRASALPNSPKSAAENAAAFTVPRVGDDSGLGNTDRDSSQRGHRNSYPTAASHRTQEGHSELPESTYYGCSRRQLDSEERKSPWPRWQSMRSQVGPTIAPQPSRAAPPASRLSQTNEPGPASSQPPRRFAAPPARAQSPTHELRPGRFGRQRTSTSPSPPYAPVPPPPPPPRQKPPWAGESEDSANPCPPPPPPPPPAETWRDSPEDARRGRVGVGHPRWLVDRDLGMYCLLCRQWAEGLHLVSKKHTKRERDPDWYLGEDPFLSDSCGAGGIGGSRSEAAFEAVEKRAWPAAVAFNGVDTRPEACWYCKDRDPQGAADSKGHIYCSSCWDWWIRKGPAAGDVRRRPPAASPGTGGTDSAAGDRTRPECREWPYSAPEPRPPSPQPPREDQEPPETPAAEPVPAVAPPWTKTMRWLAGEEL